MTRKKQHADFHWYEGDLDPIIKHGLERLPRVPPVDDRVVNIGDVAIRGHLVLAPMAGVCDHPFRWLCRLSGASAVYSEFVSSDGLVRGNNATREMLRFTEDERPIAVQIFGSDPEVIRDATSVVDETGVDIIDLNFGCPVKKVTKREAGSALLKNPRLLGEIVRAGVESAKNAPVTAKIRAGWDVVNAEEIAKIVEDNGAKAISVHGRTQKMGYTGEANWQIIADVKKNVRIPVIGNGDVFAPSDTFRMIDETGVDLVMAARGTQGAPWLFAQTNAIARAMPIYTPSWSDRLAVAATHLALMLRERPEVGAVRLFRMHLSHYTKTIPGSAAFRREVFVIDDADEVFRRLYDYADSLEHEANTPEQYV